MIQSHELSINNYVIYRGNIIKVKGIIEFNQFEPIKITEKILLNFGFTSIGPNDFSKEIIRPSGEIVFVLEYHASTQGYWTSVQSLSMEDIGYQHLRTIKYLHQLQNSYFWASGNILSPLKEISI